MPYILFNLDDETCEEIKDLAEAEKNIMSEIEQNGMYQYFIVDRKYCKKIKLNIEWTSED